MTDNARMNTGSDSEVADAPLLDIRNATIWRGSTRVFRGLDLVIERHECVAILGPNGSGKTTLLKSINREIYPVASPDTVFRILGRDRWNAWDLRRQIGVVSADLHQRYTPTTTAIEVVVSGFHSSIGIHGNIASRIDAAQVRAAERILAELGIADLRDTPLKHMSTGQQRRTLLGRALVHDPQTLIFDEPTAGLDLAAAFDYLRRIGGLVAAGRNIVIVTHHLNEIPPEVKRVVLLSEGGIARDGPKREVLTAKALSEVYGTSVRVCEVDGYYLGYPGGA